MLKIDEEAVVALEQIGAIRITATEVDGDVEVAIDEATEPSEGDEVIEQAGARVFLDAAAADVLSDQILGVHAHDDHFHFTFEDQAD
jgi:Fe-S cluster assembly iron-binding protein IscA